MPDFDPEELRLAILRVIGAASDAGEDISREGLMNLVVSGNGQPDLLIHPLKFQRALNDLSQEGEICSTVRNTPGGIRTNYFRILPEGYATVARIIKNRQAGHSIVMKALQAFPPKDKCGALPC